MSRNLIQDAVQSTYLEGAMVRDNDCLAGGFIGPEVNVTTSLMGFAERSVTDQMIDQFGAVQVTRCLHATFRTCSRKISLTVAGGSESK